MNEQLFKENIVEIVDGVLMATNRNNKNSYLDINDLIQVKSNDLVLNDIDTDEYKIHYDTISHLAIEYSIPNDCYVITYGCCLEYLVYGDWSDMIEEEINEEGEEAVEEKYCFNKSISFQSYQKAVDYFICVAYSFGEYCED